LEQLGELARQGYPTRALSIEDKARLAEDNMRPSDLRRHMIEDQREEEYIAEKYGGFIPSMGGFFSETR